MSDQQLIQALNCGLYIPLVCSAHAQFRDYQTVPVPVCQQQSGQHFGYLQRLTAEHHMLLALCRHMQMAVAQREQGTLCMASGGFAKPRLSHRL